MNWIVNSTLVIVAGASLYFASSMLDGGASWAGLDFAFSDWVD